MDLITSEELTREGYKPLAQFNKNIPAPYFVKETNKIKVLAKHVSENRYIVHKAENAYGQSYEETELNNSERFESAQGIKGLEKELSKKVESPTPENEIEDESIYTFLVPSFIL